MNLIKKMKTVFIITLMSSFLFSCHQMRKNQPPIDKFYADKGDFDLSRFPLIKPYEIVTVIPSNDWMIRSVDDNYANGSIPGTKDINVVDSVIFAHSKNTLLDGQPTAEAWFIIIPKHNIFRGFKNHSEYLDYIKLNIIKQPKMYNPSDVFSYFDSKDTLDWKDLNKNY